MATADHLPAVTFRLTLSQRAFLVCAGALILEPQILPPPFIQILGIFLLGIGILTLANLNPKPSLTLMACMRPAHGKTCAARTTRHGAMRIVRDPVRPG